MFHPKLEEIRGDFGKRIAPFVVVSCLLHLVLAISVFTPTSPEPLEKKNPRKPILVDYMEHKEGLSPEPASLSPDPMTQKGAAQDTLPGTPPPTPSQAFSAETKIGKSAKSRQGASGRDGAAGHAREKPIEAPPEVEKRVEAAPRTLPSARDLIPSVKDLMGWQARDGKLYRSDIEQDGVGDAPAQVEYNAYLSILKRRVKQRWDVSSVTDFRDATTIVWFSVGKDGSLQFLELAKSSGRVLLDSRAMAAIRSSFPMPPPPETLLDENGVLNIQFSFRYLLYPPFSKHPRQGRKWIVD